MSSSNNIESSWFAKEGNYQDVILSTRVRLIRNLADFPFPSKMTDDDTFRIKSLVYDAFSSDTDFKFLDMNDISETGRQILQDKCILEKDKCSSVILNMKDESVSCLVNESDHLKISAFVSGLDCEQAMARVYQIDDFLQTKLQFAASVDFGYLTSHIKDCGSGMKISIRVSIPSIVLNGQFNEIADELQSKKIQITPVFNTNIQNDFSNCIFDISNSNSIQGNELDQMAVIQSVGMYILKTERKIRQNFADNKPTIVLNYFKQNYGKAVYSLLLTYEEAVSIVSGIKWGLQLKLISGISEVELNALYFRLRNGHLKYLCDNFNFTFEKDIKGSQNLQIKRLRTIVIQQAFEGIFNEKSVS